MLFKTFKKRYSGTPVDLDELAEAAVKVTDATGLADAAARFLAARDAFEAVLFIRRVERG